MKIVIALLGALFLTACGPDPRVAPSRAAMARMLPLFEAACIKNLGNTRGAIAVFKQYGLPKVGTEGKISYFSDGMILASAGEITNLTKSGGTVLEEHGFNFCSVANADLQMNDARQIMKKIAARNFDGLGIREQRKQPQIFVALPSDYFEKYTQIFVEAIFEFSRDEEGKAIGFSTVIELKSVQAK